MNIGAVAAALIIAQLAPLAGSSLAATEPQFRTDTVTAPLDYRAPAHGSISVRYAVAPALDPGGAGDPIFVVEALGESGVEAAPRGLLQSLSALRQEHDLVFVDQRGVWGDGLLNCPANEPAAGAFSAARLAPCRVRFRPELLTSLHAETFAGDIETVRKRLGYRRILLVGYFYGARIATTYLGKWPEHVTAVALTDVSPPGVPAPLASAAAAEASVDATLGACRDDAACGAAYPQLADDYAKVLHEFAVSRLDPGLSGGADVDGRSVLSWLVAPTFRWTTASSWPRTVHDLAEGRGADIVPSYLRFRREVLAQFPLAERLSVECAEDFFPGAKVALAGATSNAIAGSGDGVLSEIRACKSWPHSAHRPPRPRAARTPLFALTGEADIAGSPAAARRALSPWKRARLVMLPGRMRAADNDWDQCVGPMITAFLSAPARTVDTACISSLRRPDFQVAAPPAER